MTVPSISPDEFANLRREGHRLDLIDVRTLVEYREVHADIARNIPLDRLDVAAVLRVRDDSDGPLYLICRSGSRGRQACERFAATGFASALNVEGGTMALADAGFPVVRGRKSISLERQVRIAAGLLVLLGAALAWIVHPAFLGLAAFIGAGLLFAGITDTCGMGMLLARMPWNRLYRGRRRGPSEIPIRMLRLNARNAPKAS